MIPAEKLIAEPELKPDYKAIMDARAYETLLQVQSNLDWLTRNLQPFSLSVKINQQAQSDWSGCYYFNQLWTPALVAGFSSDLKKSRVRLVSMVNSHILTDYIPAETLSTWRWAYILKPENKLAVDVLYEGSESGGRIDLQIYLLEPTG